MSRTMDNDLKSYDGSIWDAVTEIKGHKAEIERLKATLKETEQAYTDLGSHLRARVEELGVLYQTQLITSMDLVNNRDGLREDISRMWDASKENETLRARVEELEASTSFSTVMQVAADRNKAEKERDELRNQVDQRTRGIQQLNQTMEELREQLEGEYRLRDLHQETNRELRSQLAKSDEACENWAKAYRELTVKLQPAKPNVVKSTWQGVFATGFHQDAKADFEDVDEWGRTVDDKRIGVLRRDHLSDGTAVVTLETIGEKK